MPAPNLVLDASKPAEKATWRELLSRWPDREVWADPDYARLFAAEGERLICVAREDENGGILLPLILRPLDALPWIHEARGWFDATSAYGYGGPFRWGEWTDVLGLDFWRSFESWARDTRVVSSFLRLSLFAEQRADPPCCRVDKGPNVVRALDLDDDSLWYDYAHKVRKNVQRARRDGLIFEVDETGERLDEFLAIYHETMERNQAGRGYYFDRSFFEAIVRDLAGQFTFFHVLQDGEPVSTELALRSRRHLYSFLGGTRGSAFKSRPGDLLKHEATRWARARGLESFVLGGGYAPGDGIYKYKLSFAPTGSREFQVGEWIHDESVYERLVEDRRRAEQRAGVAWEPQAGFFPAYRASSSS